METVGGAAAVAKSLLRASAAWLAIAWAALTVVPVTAGAEPAGARSPMSVTTTAPGWTVTLRIEDPTAVAGRPIRASVVITDRTGRQARFDSCSANGVYGMGLENREIPQGVFTGTVACSTIVRRGRNVFRTRISTDYLSCGGDTGRTCPAPLPAGVYRTVINWPRFSAHAPAPGKLTIRLTGR